MEQRLSTIGDYIYELSVFPKVVTPKFVGELPSLSDTGCGIVLIDGADTLEYFAPKPLTDNASLFQPIIRFMIRTHQYSEGATWCDALINAFHRYHDDFLISCLFRGAVLYLGRSPEKLHEFQLTFSTIVKE